MQRNYHRHERAYTYMQVRTRLHKSYWKFTTLSSLWGLSVCFCLCTIAKGTIEPSTVADWFYVTLSLISTVFYPCRRYFMTSLQRTSVNQFHSLTAAPCYSHTSKVASPIYKKKCEIHVRAHTNAHAQRKMTNSQETWKTTRKQTHKHSPPPPNPKGLIKSIPHVAEETNLKCWSQLFRLITAAFQRPSDWEVLTEVKFGFGTFEKTFWRKQNKGDNSDRVENLSPNPILNCGEDIQCV